jgi:hypothetical protein
MNPTTPHPILSRIPFLNKYVDERFLEHRRRSSSIAGFAALFVAFVVFEYRIVFHNVIDWDMGAIILTFGVVKLAMFAWYRLKD